MKSLLFKRRNDKIWEKTKYAKPIKAIYILFQKKQVIRLLNYLIVLIGRISLFVKDENET